MFAKAFIVVALASASLAKIFTTAPVASTTYSGGKEAQIRWQDDGSAPSLKDFGPAKVSIYVGNQLQQTSLQLINGSVDVSTESQLTFTVDPSIGPNSGEYFIRFESLGLKDPDAPQFPALAFSAKFTLDSMTGNFSDAVKAQIAGQSTAPLGGAAASSTPAPGASSSTKPTSASSSAATTKSTTSASPSPSNGAAVDTRAGWAGIALGAVLGAMMF